MDADFSNDPLYHIDWGKGGVVRSLFDGSNDLEAAARTRRDLFYATVVKDPDLSFLVEDCARVFHNARLIHVVRDPRDAIRSIADRLNLSAEDLASTSVSRADIIPHWQYILDGRSPPVEGGTVIERLARRWNEAWIRSARHADPVTVLRYEDFLKDKAQAIYGLAESIQVAIKYKIDADVHVQFQPSGKPNVDLSKRLGRDNLRAIEFLCSEEMDALGYHRLTS
jgi:hypothetical protein